MVVLAYRFVMEAWKEKLGAADSAKVHFLADDAGKFTSAIGMSFDAGPILGNARSKRKHNAFQYSQLRPR
jgi:peroxiredoxin